MKWILGAMVIAAAGTAAVGAYAPHLLAIWGVICGGMGVLAGWKSYL